MKIKSSNIAEAFYSHKASFLIIVFKNGASYHYKNVPEETWNEFKASESKGKYFYYQIKDWYDCQKIEDALPPPVVDFKQANQMEMELKNEAARI